MFPYMGGKAFHIGHLDAVFPFNVDTFVDVFGGAGWVSVKTQVVAQTRVYNDLNPHLANIFHWFSQDPAGIKSTIESWPQQDPAVYRKFQQEIFGSDPIPLSRESAAKYLYLEIQSFSGNTLGLNSSVYFDKIHTINPLLKKLTNPRIIGRLQNLIVENLDWDKVIDKYDGPNVFFYLDPPYFQKEHYYTQTFDQSQHQALAQRLSSIQGQFALSYYHFDQLDQWYPQDQFARSTYTIGKPSSSKNNKQRGEELVIRNY